MTTGGAMWWLTLGLGLVVALIAVILLQIFYRLVRRIEAGSEAIWETGKKVARNTATTWMLHQTTVRLDGLTEEALRHDAFLDEALGAASGNGEAPAPASTTADEAQDSTMAGEAPAAPAAGEAQTEPTATTGEAQDSTTTGEN